MQQISWLRSTFSDQESNIEKELKNAREEIGKVVRGEVKNV